MSAYGHVYVMDNRYRVQGSFHHQTPSTPIRDADHHWALLGVTNPRDMTYMHTYGGEAPFFEALGQGRLLATRCDNQNCEFHETIYMPFRIHCPECLGRNSILDLTEIAQTSAKIHTYMVCERSGAFSSLATPIKFINVEFKGVATILMSYLSVGEPAIGINLIPIFKTVDPTYTILDLSWVVKGTLEELLPEGFTFFKKKAR